MIDFPSPILSVTTEVLEGLDGEDAVYSMWTVFTKCKQSLKDGRRLENISWRLWYREMSASHCGSPQSSGSSTPPLSDTFSSTPITPISEDGHMPRNSNASQDSLMPVTGGPAPRSWHGETLAPTAANVCRRLSSASMPACPKHHHSSPGVGKLILGMLPDKVVVPPRKVRKETTQSGRPISKSGPESSPPSVYTPAAGITPRPTFAQPQPVLPQVLLPSTPPSAALLPCPRVIVVNPTPHPTPPATPQALQPAIGIPATQPPSTHLQLPPPRRAMFDTHHHSSGLSSSSSSSSCSTGSSRFPTSPSTTSKPEQSEALPLPPAAASVPQQQQRSAQQPSGLSATKPTASTDDVTLKPSDRRRFVQQQPPGPPARNSTSDLPRVPPEPSPSASSATSSQLKSVSDAGMVMAPTRRERERSAGSGTSKPAANTTRKAKEHATGHGHARTARPGLARLHSQQGRQAQREKHKIAQDVKKAVAAAANLGMNIAASAGKGGDGNNNNNNNIKVGSASSAGSRVVVPPLATKSKGKGKVKEQQQQPLQPVSQMVSAVIPQRRPSQNQSQLPAPAPLMKPVKAPVTGLLTATAPTIAKANSTSKSAAAATTTTTTTTTANPTTSASVRRNFNMSAESDFETTDTEEDDDSEWASEDVSHDDETELASQQEETRLRQAAEEAQRQRDMFAKVPKRSYSNLNARSKSGLLSQLFNPGLLVDNPPRRSMQDMTALRRAGTGGGGGLGGGIPGGLTMTRSSAALPAMAQVTVQAPSSNGAGVSGAAVRAQPQSTQSTQQSHQPKDARAGYYRPRGRPQGQEMEEDSDSDGESLDNAIPVSQSLAEQKLAALTDQTRRRISAQVAPTAAAAPSTRAAAAAVQQQRQMTQVAPPTAAGAVRTEPIMLPVGYPYNLPAPAPPTTPRTTRRQMLSTELSESLRRNLLWERQVSKTNIIGGPRRSSGSSGSGGGSGGLLGNGLRPLTAMNQHSGHQTTSPPPLSSQRKQSSQEREPPRQLQQQQQQQQPLQRSNSRASERAASEDEFFERDERMRAAVARNKSWANEFHYSGW